MSILCAENADTVKESLWSIQACVSGSKDAGRSWDRGNLETQGEVRNTDLKTAWHPKDFKSKTLKR